VADEERYDADRVRLPAHRSRASARRRSTPQRTGRIPSEQDRPASQCGDLSDSRLRQQALETESEADKERTFKQSVTDQHQPAESQPRCTVRRW